MTAASDLLERLRAIDEELRDLAYERLKRDHGTTGQSEERRIHRARRAIARAITVLEGGPLDDRADD